MTYLTARGRYARICVEIDLSRRLKPAISIFGKERQVAYEGLHVICFHCGKYGHHRDICPEKVELNQKEEVGRMVVEKNETNGRENPEEATRETRREDETGIVDTLKRSREVSKEDKADGVTAPPQREVFGPGNIVKRMVRRSYGIPDSVEGKENNQARLLKSNLLEREARDMRRKKNIDLNVDLSTTAKFSAGANSTSRQFGKVLSNNRMWVPVDHEKRKDGRRKLKGKENGSQGVKPMKKEVGPSNIKDGEGINLVSPNPFEILMGQEEQSSPTNDINNANKEDIHEIGEEMSKPNDDSGLNRKNDVISLITQAQMEVEENLGQEVGECTVELDSG